MSNGIDGKVIIITGASSGLGEATARHLSDLGARVVLGARRDDRIQVLANEFIARGKEAMAVPTDVTRSADVQKLVDAAVAKFGAVDVMINNAGIAPLSVLESGNVDEWGRMIDVNVKGVLHGIAAVLPHMIRQKSGHIINVSSVAALRVTPGATIYAATKYAVGAISEGLRLEAKPHNIRTTVILPGAVDTELPTTISNPTIAEAMKTAYQIALPATSFARTVAFAICQPAEMDVNEIVFRPTPQV